MNQTDELLTALIKKLDNLASAIEATDLNTCKAKRACLMIGVKDPAYLTYFFDQGLLNRIGGGKAGYTYFKVELLKLQDMLKNHEVSLPNLKHNKAA